MTSAAADPQLPGAGRRKPTGPNVASLIIMRSDARPDALCAMRAAICERAKDQRGCRLRGDTFTAAGKSQLL